MRLTIESTDDVGELWINGHLVPGRVWKTDDGILVFVSCVALPDDGRDSSLFDDELIEMLRAGMH